VRPSPNRLWHLRQERYLSQEKLARLAGVNPRTVATFERGLRVPNSLTVAKLARALGVEPCELMV